MARIRRRGKTGLEGTRFLKVELPRVPERDNARGVRERRERRRLEVERE